MLKIAETEEIAIEVKKQVSFQRNWDPSIKWLDTKEIREMEPSLSPSVSWRDVSPQRWPCSTSKIITSFCESGRLFWSGNT